MRTKLRQHPYLTRALAPRIAAYCAAKGITMSAFFQGACEDRLDGEAKHNDVIIRDLARLGLGSKRHQHDLAVLSESFAVFVRTWFAFLPPIADADRPGLERIGTRRFQDFVRLVSDQLDSGPGLVAEVTTRPTAGAAPGVGAPPAAPASPGNRTPQR
jgi:hypothetical protein